MNAKKLITLSGVVLLAMTSTSLAADRGYRYDRNHNPGSGPSGAGYGQSQYVYTEVNVGPYNPPDTEWFGINNSGELVGNTAWPGPTVAGITPEITVAAILDKGTLTTWSATLPDGSTSGWSEFIEVNDKGVIVGDYLDDANPAEYHDFLRCRDGQINLLRPVEPGAFFVPENEGINNEGTIVGTFTLDPNWYNETVSVPLLQAFILKDGKYTTWAYPGATGTYFSAINDKGTIGGEWYDTFVDGYGFLLNKDGSTTSIVPPASLSPAVPAHSWVAALNNNDEVVGEYLYYDVTTDATFWRGFVLSHGIYTQIYYPNDNGDTFVESINDEGVIAGIYGDLGYGFIATPVHHHDGH